MLDYDLNIIVQDIIDKISMRHHKNVKLAHTFKHYDTKSTLESPLHYVYDWKVETSEGMHLWHSVLRPDEFDAEAPAITDLERVVYSVRITLNNNKCSACFRSFSKLLCVPLFKYRSGTLVYKNDVVNIVTLHLTVNYYDLLDECFDSTDLLIPVPFRYFT